MYGPKICQSYEGIDIRKLVVGFGKLPGGFGASSKPAQDAAQSSDCIIAVCSQELVKRLLTDFQEV